MVWGLGRGWAGLAGWEAHTAANGQHINGLGGGAGLGCTGRLGGAHRRQRTTH